MQGGMETRAQRQLQKQQEHSSLTVLQELSQAKLVLDPSYACSRTPELLITNAPNILRQPRLLLRHVSTGIQGHLPIFKFLY